MSNSGKVWDIKEVYKKERNSSWSKGDIGVSTNTSGTTVEKIQISTAGNAAAFGDITTSGNEIGGAMAGNQTRLLMGGGAQPNTSNVICYKEFSFDGNFVDFGDLSVDRQLAAGASNGLRAAFVGGRQADGGPFTTSNRMDVSTFASLGNAVDFGDLTVARFSLASMQSPTRGVFAGGSPSPSNTIDFITWSSLGNAIDFGDIGTTTTFAGFGGSSSETRGVFGGGGNPSNASIINFVTMASQGDSGDFGDLSVNRLTNSAAGNSNRVCFFGGQSQPSTSSVNTIDFVTIATRGNATDFGDMTSTTGFKCSGHSNGHGGIGLGEFQRPSVTYMPGSGKVLMMGGNRTGGDRILIDSFQLSTLGNASLFGDLTKITDKQGSAASTVKAICMGGGQTPSSYSNEIQSVNFQSEGNAADFGDLSATYYLGAGCNSTTRAIFANPRNSSNSATNTIEYFTMATAGNASDFGNATVTMYNRAAFSSPIRGVIGGGDDDSSQSNVMDYITIASTGDATDFGDLSQTDAIYGLAALSNSTRGVYGGGRDVSPNAATNIMQYVTIASTGNSTDFGDLTTAREMGEGAANATRGIFIGGRTPTIINTTDFITIASTGNATDFGDMTEGSTDFGCGTDFNGGLQA